ncbi:Oligopeptide transport ATP-binding protein OppF [Candidatus Rhodobacter oscarellae]|uniref:Oligopeptide transport ATP-binding protein OppF n=1 Tax=Candidatus Rhodobacter oscarellae TaxID=1675527 RepID=A0A0J9GVZ2_9RHOB|nr:ATP-binding cassette domain-containing protein [Candidatus Rhodobacter lobularis]KMW57733.1 Oligopeptide transport ATP-binding protein OppF [Candidatus Rhodobacter lobularis]
MTLDDVSLSLAAGKTLAVVGESGAGKSTLINAILGLVPCHAGEVTWKGAPVRQCRPALVMQEPRSAFNPRLALRRSVLEPLAARGAGLDHDRLNTLCAGLEIAPDMLDRRPQDVSVGQAQRAGILRALIAAPPLVLFDEPLSALDAVTQKHTARLIAQLQREEGFAALIVTHDLGYAAAFADDIAVLRAGRIEELGPARDVVDAPQSEYGQTLRDAAFALGALERVS